MIFFKMLTFSWYIATKLAKLIGILLYVRLMYFLHRYSHHQIWEWVPISYSCVCINCLSASAFLLPYMVIYCVAVGLVEEITKQDEPNIYKSLHPDKFNKTVLIVAISNT